MSAHAHLAIEASLYPGPNFHRLASYLQHPFERQRRRVPTPPGGPSQFPFVHHYRDLSAPGHDRVELSRPEDFPHDSGSKPKGGAGSLMFIRGLPSAEWLATIGGSHRVDPEFFQRHLNFLTKTSQIDYYAPALLPSSSNYIVQLRYMSIAKRRPFGTGAATLAGTASIRSDLRRKMDSYLPKLASTIDTNTGTGDSIVRDLYFFGNGHLVLEQTISLSVTWMDGRWTGKATNVTSSPLVGPFYPS